MERPQGQPRRNSLAGNFHPEAIPRQEGVVDVPAPGVLDPGKRDRRADGMTETRRGDAADKLVIEVDRLVVIQ